MLLGVPTAPRGEKTLLLLIAPYVTDFRAPCIHLYSSQLPPAHESLPPTPQTHAPPQSASAGSHQGSMQSGAGTGADSQASGSQVINMRCLIVTNDASVIIGKQGRHIAEIRVSIVGAQLQNDCIECY